MPRQNKEESRVRGDRTLDVILSNMPSQELGERLGDVGLLEDDADGRRERAGEEHARDAPKDAPEGERGEDGDGVEVEAITQEARLNEVADAEVKGGGQGKRQEDFHGHHRLVDSHNRDGEKARDDGPDVWDEGEDYVDRREGVP